MKTQLSPQDWQQLSAYLDGQLSTTEKERLETRLRSQTSLRSGLEEISQTRTLLRSVPRRKVPHNFVLTRAMVAEQARRRSAWFPVLSFTSLVSLVSLVVISLLSQFRFGALPAAPAVPVAMQAARSDQAGSAQPTSEPMIIQWGSGGMGGGGGDGGVNPPLANGMGGGPAQEPPANSLMKGQATPEAGIEAAPAATEAAGVPNLDAPNPGVQTEAPAATPQPFLSAPSLEATPSEIPIVPTPPAEATGQPAENTPTPGVVAQQKALPAQSEGPVILGIAPTQDQGLIQSTPPTPDTTSHAPSAPFNYLPFIQGGLVALAVIAGVLAFWLRKKTRL
jgi:hypothetical protein